MPTSSRHQRPSKNPSRRRPAAGEGLSQHSLVEHALCPLDARRSLQVGLLHTASYRYQDRSRNMKRAEVTVAAPFGLSPNDEFYLWGLAALHLGSSDEEATELVATPHWCLRQLGVVDARQNQGKRYRLFREAIARLSGVVYRNTRFYDPVRGEHRDVAFGLLKYSLPIDGESSRAWRIHFDPQFLAFCQSAAGSFAFDLETYRTLDPASRRLFLLLSKIFWRRTESPTFDLRHLAVDVLGFEESIALRDLKRKVLRVAQVLQRLDVVTPPESGAYVTRREKGRFNVSFRKGAYFDRDRRKLPRDLTDSPLVDPLRSIGFDAPAIAAILREHSPKLVAEWADITLAAIERKLVTKDPRAYFRYYVALAAAKQTTPPDWWRELRKQEERKQWERDRAAAPMLADALAPDESFETRFDAYLAADGRAALDRVTADIFGSFAQAGETSRDARLRAEKMARDHLRNRFRSEHGEASTA